MKQTIKSFLEDITGATVVAKKVNYTKTGFNRKYSVLDLGMSEEVEEELVNILPCDTQTEVNETDSSMDIKITVSYDSPFSDWKEFESSIEFPEAEEECDCDEEKEVPTPFDIEAIVSELKVGYNYVPGIGEGYCTDEHDLENMKHFVRGALTMFNMFNL